ncbi:nucleic acid/nucleotide deaminase domain-containing protein [Streptomyces murinus]|uniref:nucleic acid/nucleotide deaminase domain-containing protein n=1 Tax=Streptomyces murinus TaxID=33900 RepID=UPI003F45D89C
MIRLRSEQITALYTERQLCPACDSALTDKLKPGTPVTWSVPYHPSYGKEAKELLDRYVRAGCRPPPSRKRPEIQPDSGGGYVNGQHRAQAMLEAGVRRTVVLRYVYET